MPCHYSSVVSRIEQPMKLHSLDTTLLFPEALSLIASRIAEVSWYSLQQVVAEEKIPDLLTKEKNSGFSLASMATQNGLLYRRDIASKRINRSIMRREDVVTV